MDGSFDVTELRITASDSVAFCHALVKVSGAKVRVTIGLRKGRGHWLIAHEHHSYPIELNSEPWREMHIRQLGCESPESPAGGFLIRDLILLGAALYTAGEALHAAQ